MKKIFFFLLLILGSCSLTGEQEQALNSAVTSYVDVRNDAILLSFVALTHPNVVAYYKDLGDSLFLNKFNLNEEHNWMYIQDGNQKLIEKSSNNIHVKYSFIASNEFAFDNGAKEIFIYAVSNDSGVNWFFVDEVDYTNNDIIPEKDRLIK